MKQLLILTSLFLGLACSRKENLVVELNPTDVEMVIQQMTDVMIHDVTNPPLAARFFAYSCLAANEVIALHDTTLMSMSGKLNEFPNVINPKGGTEINKDIAAL
ncbi:MAG: haloperoxidase, partial [Bacteroidota bacterium]